MKDYYGPLKLGDVGTLIYMAPEIWLRTLNADDRGALQKVDMWSLGCVLYEVVTLERAFKSENQALEGDYDRLKRDVTTGNFKPIGAALAAQYGQEFVDLVHRLLDHEPENRPSCKEILNMDFIQEFMASKGHVFVWEYAITGIIK